MKECKPCETTKVCNKATGRCVLKTGQIGKKILATMGTQSRKSQTSQARDTRDTPKVPGNKTGCKKPCPSDKICNPASSRCVLKSGKIGRSLLGNRASPSTSQASPSTSQAPPKREKTRWVPLTFDEVKKQMPTSYLDYSQEDHQDRLNSDELNTLREHRFGPYLEYMTIEMAHQLIGKEIYIVGGQTPVFGNPIRDIWKAVIHKMVRRKTWPRGSTKKDEIVLYMTEYHNIHTAYPDIEETDFWMVELNRGEKALGKYVFSVDSIPLHVFVKKSGQRVGQRVGQSVGQSGRQAKTQPVVNASRRQTSTGTAQKTPTGRKSPAGHAKNFANKTAVGLDGQMWISKQGPSGRWTWRRV